MSENINNTPKAPKAIIEQLPAASEHAEDPAKDAFDAAQTAQDTKQSFAHAWRAKAAGEQAGFRETTVGFFEGVGKAAWAYANAHPHATLYGLLGFVLAVLILVIGLWDTIVIALFVGVGTIIGQMVDGDNAAVNFIARILNGRR